MKNTNNSKAWEDCLKDLDAIKNGVLRQIVNSHDPSLNRFFQQERLKLIADAILIVQYHMPRPNDRNTKKKRKKV